MSFILDGDFSNIRRIDPKGPRSSNSRARREWGLGRVGSGYCLSIC
ncbi:hypothetical protein KEJ19_02185 [Candidatus Bathyarchaeota archaeon]|nr:hypothetical protein [Candidatus Bathyarchaeota archaeon]